jgi:azurin
VVTLPVAFAACSRKPEVPRQAVDLYVESDGDFLAFRPDELTCSAGAVVHLTFHHAGVFLNQAHNWVLVFPHQMEAVDRQASKNDGEVSIEDPRVIAVVEMCGKGETVTTQFTAPARGDYPFFCSTPGHAETMTGVLRVTA